MNILGTYSQQFYLYILYSSLLHEKVYLIDRQLRERMSYLLPMDNFQFFRCVFIMPRIFIKTPMTSYPFCFNRKADTLESTPPDNATITFFFQN